MAHVFFKQPNGKYAVFSTVTDSFIFWDYDTLQELKQDWVENEVNNYKELASNRFDAAINRMDNNKNRYITWKEAKSMHNDKQKKTPEYKIK